MIKKILPSVAIVLVATVILFISILKSASREVKFNSPVYTSPEEVRIFLESNIDYKITNPGTVLPGNILWPIKAIRDRVWLVVTPNLDQKTELYILFADKRLGAGVKLFERGDYELGYNSLQRAAHYLMQASDTEKRIRHDHETQELLLRIYRVSMGHYETLENLISIAPEDAQPEIIKIQDTSRIVNEAAIQGLLDMGYTPLEMNLTP